MKTFALAAAALLISGSAFAQSSSSITGTVHTTVLVSCQVGTGCTNTVTSATIDTTVGGIPQTTTLSGNLSSLASLNGQIATVTGNSSMLVSCQVGTGCNNAVNFSVTGAAPAAAQPLTVAASAAASSTTEVGTIHTYCLNGGNTCRAFITTTVGGIETSERLSGTFSDISQYDGQIAQITGNSYCLNGGDTCRFVVSSISGAAAQPLTAPSADVGSNVGRDASTTAVSSSSTAAVSSTGVGIKRN